MKEKDFDALYTTIKPDLRILIRDLKKELSHISQPKDSDEPPYIQLTISTDDDGDSWDYQTGDNCYSGACYGSPYQGSVYITADCIAEDAIDDLLSNLEDAIIFDDAD